MTLGAPGDLGNALISLGNQPREAAPGRDGIPGVLPGSDQGLPGASLSPEGDGNIVLLSSFDFSLKETWTSTIITLEKGKNESSSSVMR